MIHNSIIIICLDGAPSESEKLANNYVTSSAIKCILGGDAKSNAANRWYDHCGQVCVLVLSIMSQSYI